MSEIPEDVMRKAYEVAFDLPWHDNLGLDDYLAPIARALMAERERAAMIAETLAGKMEQAAMNGFSLCEREQNALRAEASRSIAAAIRKGQG